MCRIAPFAVLFLVLRLASASAAPKPPLCPFPPGAVRFEAHRIATFRSEACEVADFDNDGRLDIVAGPYLYLAPDWKAVKIRTLEGDVDDAGKGYWWDFMNAPVDVDGDGKFDVVSCSWHGQRSEWYRNIGTAAGEWPRAVVEENGHFECGERWDIDGDGLRNEILPHVLHAEWYEVAAGPDGRRGLVRHLVSEKPTDYGGGVGDVNSDGRPDILKPGAWYEAPPDPRAGTWKEHPLAVGNLEPGKVEHTPQIWVYDVDADGLNDLVTSSAHRYGIFWYRQIREGDAIRWEQRVIDRSWTQAHSLALADLDHDGDPDLVTGKRFMAHNGTDPEEDAPLGVYWYELTPGPSPAWTKHVISYGEGIGSGMSIPVVDLDADGDLDIVVTGKWGGPVWFENKALPRAEPAAGAGRRPHAEPGAVAERIGRYEDAAREAWQKPDEVVRALALPPDAAVADIGSGSGYFTVRLARAVPAGRVIGIDVEPALVDHVNARARREGLHRLKACLAAADDPGLETGSVDRILLVNTYHHLPDRPAYLRKLARALRPGGRIAVVDFTKEARHGPPPAERLSRDEVAAEAASAGLRLVREHAFLSEQYFLEVAPEPRRVLLLIGGKHHEFDRIGGMIRKGLEDTGGYVVTVTHEAAELRADAVRKYDVVALYTLRFAKNDQEAYRRIAPEEQEGLAAWVKAGGPLVVLHTTIAAFDEWPEFRRLVGGAWNWQRSKHDPYQDMAVRVDDPSHPILRGMSGFTLRDELYYNMDVDRGVHVLARATSVESKQESPMAWTWRYGDGRVVFIALGHGPESWESAGLQRMVVNGLAWAGRACAEDR